MDNSKLKHKLNVGEEKVVLHAETSKVDAQKCIELCDTTSCRILDRIDELKAEVVVLSSEVEWLLSNAKNEFISDQAVK